MGCRPLVRGRESVGNDANSPSRVYGASNGPAYFAYLRYIQLEYLRLFKTYLTDIYDRYEGYVILEDPLTKLSD
jgi:hypothetical protein